ncbi:snare-like protein [Ceraceosorus guamensis]|uniref:Synaptobrevin homolog YKT6 n=1 Tax=Ceraceosorus guamensis TaxID=1522189 RepID=A0A316W4B4_9BASI|nr:snare-like protein [Ceraceosorus guamensis]PWN44766.1 snare-like protein [Ceraceosorus guamensis]
MIVLALVASGSDVLTESHDHAHERFLTAADTILARIPASSESNGGGAQRLTYTYESWLFHYLSQDGLTFLCCADHESGRRLPFALLSEVQKEFLATFDAPLLDSPAPSDFNPFDSKLTQLLKRFNDAPDSDPVKAAQAELAGVKDIMTKNIEQILNRGETLEFLMNRTDNAAQHSMAFRRRAVGVRRNMWWKNVKIMLLAAMLALVS